MKKRLANRPSGSGVVMTTRHGQPKLRLRQHIIRKICLRSNDKKKHVEPTYLKR